MSLDADTILGLYAYKRRLGLLDVVASSCRDKSGGLDSNQFPRFHRPVPLPNGPRTCQTVRLESNQRVVVLQTTVLTSSPRTEV